MIERLRSWLPLLPLFMLLGAAYWLNLQVQSSAGGTDKNMRHDPDYIIDNFTATTLDAQGKIRFVMSAKKMWHYPDDDTTHLEEPNISSHSAGKPPMSMSAQIGELSRKGDDIYLRNNVVVRRPAIENRSELLFNTDYLHVVPNKHLADTHLAVSMTDARTRLNAVGMELDYKANTIKFMSHVKTVYVPVKK